MANRDKASHTYRYSLDNYVEILGSAQGSSTPGTLGEFLVQKASHKSYQGYLFHKIIQILSLSSPFGVSTTSHISRLGYTPAPDLAPAPSHLLPQPRRPFKRTEKCP